MNIPNKNKLRSQVSTTSAPSLFPASSAGSLIGTDSGSHAKAPNEPPTGKLSGQRLQPDSLLITKSTSSLLAIQQERISSALKLKRRNLFTKSASEDSDLQQQESPANLQADVRSPASCTAPFVSGSVAAHQTIRWRRFLQMRRGKSVCSESVTDLSTSSLTSSFTVTSTETEHDSNLKVNALAKHPVKGKPPLYSTQSTQSLTNKLDNRFATKLAHRSTNKSDNRLNVNKPDGQPAAGCLSDTLNQPNTEANASKASEPCTSSTTAAATFGTPGFRYHKKRRSRKGSYRSNLRSNHGALTSQYFRTSFDSAVGKRNAALNLYDTSRACSFDNACLASASSLNYSNYSNQTISSLGISYLIDDVHQLSLDDNER